MTVSTEQQAEGREVESAARSGAHTHCPGRDSLSSLTIQKQELTDPTGSPPTSGRTREAPSLMFPPSTSQGIET